MEELGNLIIALLQLAVIVVAIAGIWMVYVKANQPGWACLIPIYGFIVQLQIAGKPWWWIFLMFIPFVNLIIYIMVNISIAEKFGKGAGFGLGLTFLAFIFYPLLGFGNASYRG